MTPHSSSVLNPSRSFFQRFGDPRHLHSFPTRRSSDLVQAGCSVPRTGPTTCHRVGPHQWSGRRSEEHTSELQSRFDLVCRLLLEKKKKIKKSTCTPIQKTTRQHVS